MKNRFTQKTCTAKTVRHYLAALLAVSMLFGMSACAKQNSAEIEPITVEREPGPQALQTANEATALALRYYIYARLETEAFVEAAYQSMPDGALESQMDMLVSIWETADVLASGAEKITDQAVLLLETASADQTAAYVQPQPQYRTLTAKRAAYSPIPLADGGREIDPETWAENLSKQYDALRGAQRYKQLAQQLGTDTKTAVEQMALAQKIIRNAAALEEAQAETAEYTRSINVVEGYKTASKVGLFVGATIATGGGSLSSLAGSSVTLGKAGAVIVGGVDCIVEVGATTSSIVLGENHQVTVDFQQAGDVIQPVSMVIGLATMNPNDTADQIALIGESMMEWFNPGKITAVGVEKGKSLGTKIIAQLIEAAENDIPGIKEALEMMGLSLPAEKGVSISELTKSFTVNAQTALAIMRELQVKTAEPDLEEETQSPQQIDPVEQPVEINISGLYKGTSTVTAAKNDTLGSVEDMTFRIVQNSNGTATLIINENSVEGAYNPQTREFNMEYGFVWRLIFASDGETITAKGTMTSDETGEGYTQEITLDLKRTGN